MKRRTCESCGGPLGTKLREGLYIVVGADARAHACCSVECIDPFIKALAEAIWDQHEREALRRVERMAAKARWN